jgi:cytochrome c553
MKMKPALFFWVFALIVPVQSQIEESQLHSTPPYWAFAVNPTSDVQKSPAKPDETPRHVPGSEAAFTIAQVKDLFSAPDWHPAGHPTMPEVVAHGRKPDLYACGYCHLPNGQGRPENSSLSGLPFAYIVHQMADFKNGLRKSSEPKHLPASNMVIVGSKANDQEISAAAKYFSALPRLPWIRVVETKTVPKTQVAGWMLVASEPAESEPIGQRIIEMPENLERTELRDDTSAFVAYVPEGSIQKGRALATTGGSGKTAACAKCHGRGLKGTGNVPSIAGRSPSYIIRQLYDIQNGARAGVLTQQMRAPVAKLTLDDMIAIAAYTASLRP